MNEAPKTKVDERDENLDALRRLAAAGSAAKQALLLARKKRDEASAAFFEGRTSGTPAERRALCEAFQEAKAEVQQCLDAVLREMNVTRP